MHARVQHPDEPRAVLSLPLPMPHRDVLDLLHEHAPDAPMWIDGGTWHLSDWRLIERRMDDLRAEGRRVTLHAAGRGYVRMRFTTLATERFREHEGDDAARATDDAETWGAC